MELVGFAKELLQSAAETVVSYRIGQVVLRQADRVLWVIEKSARWAVPPALENDDSSSPPMELIRPLPWFFFLWLLVILRVARESMSLVNLIFGKPPVRPADVVMYIQSKRRYLRALKYQGNRNMRARVNRQQTNEWMSSVYNLFQLTMCFQRPTELGNNNNTHCNDDDEVLVVKRTKKKRVDQGHANPTSDENTMERLIEKMVDMSEDSSDDSDYTLTNATTMKSDTSTTSDEEGATNQTLTDQENRLSFSTPMKPNTPSMLDMDCSHIKEEIMLQSLKSDQVTGASLESATEASEILINSEQIAAEVSEINATESPTKKPKIANGQTVKISPNNKKESPKRRDSEVPVVKITPADDSFNTNGQSSEGSYSQVTRNTPARPKNSEEAKPKPAVPNKNSGKSSKANKTKESKIKAPFWKKSKK